MSLLLSTNLNKKRELRRNGQRRLFRDGSVEDLRSEEAALGLLNDLLVDVVGRVVHDDGAVLGVNLGVETGLADQVDNPLLAVVGVEAELGAEVANVHAREDLAVALADEVAGGLDKGIGGGGEEEVGAADVLGHAESLAGGVEVVGNVEGVDELGDGVGVLVGLLADVADDVLELLLLGGRVAGTGAAGDDGGNQVAQDPRAAGLDGVDVGGGEEHVEDGLAGALVVEQGEQSPVDQHGAVVELSAGVVEELGVNVLADVLELVDGSVPVGRKDFASKLAPRRGRDLVIVGGQNAELVEHIGGGAVLAASELELAKVVEGVDHFDGDLRKEGLA